MTAVIVDANLLLLLVVGSASRTYIGIHKRLSHCGTDDFALLVEVIARFSEIILVPHVMAEVSSLARQIRDPAKAHIQAKLAQLVESTTKAPVPSQAGVRRDEFDRLGLTDAVMLHLCASRQEGLGFTLLTADTGLAIQAGMLGYGCLNFNHLRDPP